MSGAGGHRHRNPFRPLTGGDAARGHLTKSPARARPGATPPVYENCAPTSSFGTYQESSGGAAAARIVEDQALRSELPDLPDASLPGRTPQRWVIVNVDEAYIHCRKHIPQMQPVPQHRAWGTDDAKRKGGDYFGAQDTGATTGCRCRPRHHAGPD